MLWAARVFRSFEWPKVQEWKTPASYGLASPSRRAFHDTWKVAIMADGQQGAGRSETIEAIAGRLRTEYDFKSLNQRLRSVLKVVQDLALASSKF
jgi:hypothetical protein